MGVTFANVFEVGGVLVNPAMGQSMSGGGPLKSNQKSMASRVLEKRAREEGCQISRVECFVQFHTHLV